MTPRVTAVVVTYRRTDELRRTVDAIRGQTRPPDHILIVDNGDMAASVLSDDDNVEIVVTGDNLGPAGGYEVGFTRSIAGGADKLWAVDDDDVPAVDCLERLLAESQGVDVVFPVQHKPGKVQGHPPSWNGPLIDSDAVRRVGPPRADLFFWTEDTEFFFRVRQAGVPIRRSTTAVMFHDNPADRPRGSARDWRLYYEVRNGLWFRLRVVDRTPRQLWRAVRMVFGKLGAIILLEPQKAVSLRLWWRGIRDFMKGQFGRTLDPETWRADLR